jgi:hypothetical protein
VPQAIGGPDDFGYMWSNAVPFHWIDAKSLGTNSGVYGGYVFKGPVNIGFNFQFYENTYSRLYFSTKGLISFEQGGTWYGNTALPVPAPPNNIIVPLWYDLGMYKGNRSNAGIFTYQGGAAPNRYFVVEWFRSDGYSGDGASGDDYADLTFEAILYENGNIEFQYSNLSGTPMYWQSATVGIEDKLGYSGLQRTSGLSNNTAMRFTRPGPAARVAVSPRNPGAFTSPGGATRFNQTILNTGELGLDTYDLFASSSWPMTLYSQDGITPLTDTDGDGTIDTGPITQGGQRTIIVKVNTPVNATSGQSNNGQLTARSSLNTSTSKTMKLQTAVPAMFAQSVEQDYSPRAGFYRPTDQRIRQTTTSSGHSPAVATTPDGNIIQVWYDGYTNSQIRWVDELYYAVLDRYANIVRSAAKLTNNGSAALETYDHSPAIAVAPNGNVGIVWYRFIHNSSTGYNYNVFYMILNSAGGIVVPPTNLTNNAQWGSSGAPNVPRFFEPNVAATTNNRFVIAWRRYLYTGSTYQYTIWYTVRGTSGGQIKAATQFGSSTRAYYPDLTALANSTVLLTYDGDGSMGYGRLDSAGNVLNGFTSLSTYGYYSDAAQLPNGNIVLVWDHWNGTKYLLQYAVLSSSLGIIKGVTTLPPTSPAGDADPSVTYSGNRAVITWYDACCDYRVNLYYALLDGAGSLLTSPMIFASDNANYSLYLPTNGQGNTYLPGASDLTPPTNPTSLTSNDHTVNLWSNDNAVNVAWSGATDSGGSGLDGYSVLWDTSASSTPGPVKDVERTVASLTSPALSDGNWYFHIRAIDYAGNVATSAAHLGPFKLDTIAPQSAATSPEFVTVPFTVEWSGMDANSGINYHRIEVQDNLGGWTTWLNNTTATSATYATGLAGHTYDFRSVAVDSAGNVETDLPDDGDTHTTVAAFKVTGRVFNNRHQSIFNADVSTAPTALNPAKTDGMGNYTLYLASPGTYNVTASRSDFAALPPQINLSFTGNTAMSEFVLPPVNDTITNGGWETGDLSGWSVDPAITATVGLAAAHTGNYGLQLRTPAAIADDTPVVTQTILISGTQPMLSFMYRVAQGSSDPFGVSVIGDSTVITRSLDLTPGDWTHTWLDLTTLNGQTITVTFSFQDPTAVQEIHLDEISIGDTAPGGYSIYLPIVRRG